MVDIDVYEIDGTDYILLEELVIGVDSYLYLSNSEDKTDVIFRKRDRNDKELLTCLENDEEVKRVALVFVNKLFRIN